MPGPRTIPADRSTDLATVDIFSNGEKIPASIPILGVNLSRFVNRIPSATILVNDGDPSQETFEVSSGELFAPGRAIRIDIGYHNDNSTVFEGIIVRHRISVAERGGSMLQVECKDPVVKLTSGRRNRLFRDMSDKDAIGELIDARGLQKDLEDTSVVHQQLVQYYATDWDFILCRAEMNGQVVVVDDGEVIVKKPVIGEPKLELTFGATIFDFEAGMDVRDHHRSVRSSGWNIADQELSETDAGGAPPETAGNISSEDLAGILGDDGLELRHSGFRPDAELQNWADAALAKSRLTKIRGRVKCQGFAGIRPGDTIRLHGLGDRFNGNIFAAGVSHRVSSGKWFTEIAFGLPPKWFYQEEDIIERPAAGMLPAVNGFQTGVVRQLEGDPEGQERIRVSIPVIDAGDEGIWARLLLTDAGSDRGVVFRPDIGDEVLVGFVNDDPRDAVVMGMLHSGAHPAPIPADDQNPRKGIVTREKLKLIFDDDEPSVRIETPAGNILLLSDAGEGLKFQDQNGNGIAMGPDGIRIESASDLHITASGDVKVEGMNITNSANASFEAEGSGGASLKSSAITEVQGSMVKIN
jgi:Rhs element Vgr protein